MTPEEEIKHRRYEGDRLCESAKQLSREIMAASKAGLLKSPQHDTIMLGSNDMDYHICRWDGSWPSSPFNKKNGGVHDDIIQAG